MEIEKLKMAEIKSSDLSDLIISALEEMDCFSGSNGKIYSGLVFEECLAQRAGLEYQTISNDTRKALEELKTLDKRMRKFDYVMVINN